MKIVVEKMVLLKLLEKINNGALTLPQQGVLAFIRGKDPSKEFEEYVNSLMLAVASAIELSDMSAAAPSARVLPKRVIPMKIKATDLLN